MNSSKEDLKKHILDYLVKNKRMTLATCDDNTPWAATVMFAYDSDLNLYFISNPDTRKIKYLEKNPRVSCTINEFINKKGSTMGIQLEGKAQMLDKNENEKELAIFTKRFSWADKYLGDHELYKIIPTKIWYLDDELFGPGGREELVI